MEIKVSKKEISFNKILNSLDTFTIDFCKILEKQKIKYVVVSGYVAILFGRNRASEDIDILIEKMDFGKFKELWEELMATYECVNPCGMQEAYYDYLTNKTAIRFALKGEFTPNAEVKFCWSNTDRYSLGERIKVSVNNDTVYISPIETQIAYKLFLGSEKDLEDAAFLYDLFKERLDKNKLRRFMRIMKVDSQLADTWGIT